MSSQNSSDMDAENAWGTLDENVKRTVIALRDYAQQKETDFQTILSLCPSDLCVFLKEFYLTLKDNNACNGATGSHLQRVRSDLSEYFKKVANLDIVTGSEFAECNSLIDESSTSTPAPAQPQAAEVSAKPVMVKKHTRQRTFTFETDDLRKIYMGDAMNLDQPETLQNKVFFDVCMYICNRGKDFLRLMTKNDLEISSDENGRRYVWLKYDSKFSFNEVAGGMTCEGSPGQQIGERMYARPGDPKCPVLSYTKYAIHLHPMSDAFWQRPKRSVLATDFVWFDNICIGNSTLNKLMNRITQSAGLPDSYAINAIKPSYIPIIESICRSALFGSQQFRRILQMKHPPNESHQVRKRHSEGSLTIASTLRESPMFRPRHSEPQLPIFKPMGSEVELMRSNSASPILRGSWEIGPPPAIFAKMPGERPRNSPDSGVGGSAAGGYPGGGTGYPRHPGEVDYARYTYAQGYRNGDHESLQERAEPPVATSSGNKDYHHGDEDKKKIETSSILAAKHKCLDIVHSLEVRHIKSFINWMKTFEVKHGPGGLMVTCQPVNAAELEHQASTGRAPAEQNGLGSPYQDSLKSEPSPYSKEASPYNKEPSPYSKYEDTRRSSLGSNRSAREQQRQDFTPTRVEFESVKDTHCSVSDPAALKVTIPTQDTCLLTGLRANAQVLIHNSRDEGKFTPLQSRVYTSNHPYDLDQIEAVMLQEAGGSSSKYEPGYLYDSNRSNCYKEEKSIPMKKRFVVDQSDHGSPQSVSQTMSPPAIYPHPHAPSPPQHPFSPYHSQQRYGMQIHPGYPSTSVPPPVPKYRERFPDGWGYIPLQKRQKFGIALSSDKEEGPLDLMKPN